MSSWARSDSNDDPFADSEVFEGDKSYHYMNDITMKTP